MKNLLLFLSIFLIVSKAQVYLPRSNCYIYLLQQKCDTIQFLKVGKDLASNKPVILFCQGSLPIPLIIDYGKDE